MAAPLALWYSKGTRIVHLLVDKEGENYRASEKRTVYQDDEPLCGQNFLDHQPFDGKDRLLIEACFVEGGRYPIWHFSPMAAIQSVQCQAQSEIVRMVADCCMLDPTSQQVMSNRHYIKVMEQVQDRAKVLAARQAAVEAQPHYMVAENELIQLQSPYIATPIEPSIFNNNQSVERVYGWHESVVHLGQVASAGLWDFGAVWWWLPTVEDAVLKALHEIAWLELDEDAPPTNPMAENILAVGDAWFKSLEPIASRYDNDLYYVSDGEGIWAVAVCWLPIGKGRELGKTVKATLVTTAPRTKIVLDVSRFLWPDMAVYAADIDCFLAASPPSAVGMAMTTYRRMANDMQEWQQLNMVVSSSFKEAVIASLVKAHALQSGLV